MSQFIALSSNIAVVAAPLENDGADANIMLDPQDLVEIDWFVFNSTHSTVSLLISASDLPFYLNAGGWGRRSWARYINIAICTTRIPEMLERVRYMCCGQLKSRTL